MKGVLMFRNIASVFSLIFLYFAVNFTTSTTINLLNVWQPLVTVYIAQAILKEKIQPFCVWVASAAALLMLRNEQHEHLRSPILGVALLVIASALMSTAIVATRILSQQVHVAVLPLTLSATIGFVTMIIVLISGDQLVPFVSTIGLWLLTLNSMLTICAQILLQLAFRKGQVSSLQVYSYLPLILTTCFQGQPLQSA
jgi:drug/metabolite transporter (DMT)-like permease